MRLYPIWDILHQGPYDSLLETLLSARSLSPDDLNVGPEAIHPPELLADLPRAAERLARACREGERIVVYGDYDADGVAATTLLLDFFEHVGACCDYLLPDRHADGYGIKPAGVERAIEKGADLIVTGSRGVGDLHSLFLGSVSHKLAQDSRCPCLVVK